MKADRASSTAKVIAAAAILLGSERHDRDPVAPGAAELCRIFLSGSFADRLLARSARFPPTRALWRLIEKRTLPGIIAHYWNRKRWIERHCRLAIAEGFERVVILGAGFDTLGVRISREFKPLEVIEMDHPATQRVKRLALDRNRGVSPETVRFVSLDLTQGFISLEALERKSTLWILEGLLMYLTEPEIAGLFGALGESGNIRTRLIFSFMTKWPEGGTGFRPQSRLIESWLKCTGEPFHWALDPRDIRDFLEARGFTLLELALTRDLGSELSGENLVICEKVSRHPADSAGKGGA